MKIGCVHCEYLSECSNAFTGKAQYCGNYAHVDIQEKRGGKRSYSIYAVDFDGTLCVSSFPEIGAPNMRLINHLIKRKKKGNKLILWTCRVGERLAEAVSWCKDKGLEFDAINSNLPEMIEYWGNDPRKVFADVYIDDKAKNKAKYCVPYKGEGL